MMIVVRQGGVVVVLASGNPGGTGAVLAALEDVVIVSTEEAVLSQGEFVAGLEPPHASAASKALHVIDLRLRSHHVIILAKTLATLVAFRTK